MTKKMMLWWTKINGQYTYADCRQSLSAEANECFVLDEIERLQKDLQLEELRLNLYKRKTIENIEKLKRGVI